MWQFDKFTNTFIPGVLPADDSKFTACYTRLSQEDEQEGDSGSILNQRDFLLKYCKEQGLSNVFFFSDESIILGLSQEVLAPQGFPGLVLIFIAPGQAGHIGG